MVCIPKTPSKSLSPAWLKVKPGREQFEQFKAKLSGLVEQVNSSPNESEEHHKNHISDFLKFAFPTSFINTNDRIDLAIHNGKLPTDSVGVIIETKRPSSQTEMPSQDNFNVKAMQELVLYYLRERIAANNLAVKHLIITNGYEWFIFDAHVFEKAFANNRALVKQFKEFEAGRLSAIKTEVFYNEIAKPAIEKMGDVEFTHFDLREKTSDKQLIALLKLFSPEHLLKTTFVNDSNSLNKDFYSELLHIIGLIETKEGSKKLIRRKNEGERNRGSLLENAITRLDVQDRLRHFEKLSLFGETKQEQLFNVGLELVITWTNRILFLKLLEAQLITYHKGDRSYAFLNSQRIRSFDEMDNLFFEVLARKPDMREEPIKQAFAKVPYLNSSLFEPTEIESKSLFIGNLVGEVALPLFGATVLKDAKGKRRTGELNTLEYLFAFLDAYDFASEGKGEIKEDNKALINASVLGLIFEKINGYKDGSFFTPGFITMYMCRETLRRAVVQKFNEVKGWACESLTDLYNKIEDRDEANTIINSLKICDPAVGSGHFLVSALNELIAIKSELGILQDTEGKRLKNYSIDVVNDELVVLDEEGDEFSYNPTNPESARVQKTLFHEKQTLIENCLFGVDINPNSVKICRLRLWIELLKNAYYNADGQLETLPNIDINIKVGNSLISRFALNADLKDALKKSKLSLSDYRNAVNTYRNATSKEQKREMERLIAEIKNDFRSEILYHDPKAKKLIHLGAELKVLELPQTLLEESAKEKKERKQKQEKLKLQFDKLNVEIEEIKNNKIYENAFEWRFEFPEVLNDEGAFVGFDVVIGNPPYVVLSSYSDSEFEFLQDTYKTAFGRINTFAMFTERATQLLAANAVCTLIIPDSICNIDYYMKLRKFLLDSCTLHEIIELGDGVFDEAVVPAIIFSFSNYPALNNSILIGNQSSPIDKNNHEIPQLYYYKTPKFSFNLHIDDLFVKVQSLLETGHAALLENVAEIKIGICTGGNSKHLSNAPVFSNSKKVLQGRDINRYELQYNNLFVNYDRGELLRARDEAIFLYEEKLLMRQTSDKLILAYDDEQYYTIDSLFIIYSDKINLKYLLALLNSKLLNRQYQKLNPEQGRVFAQVKIDYVNELPIVVNEAYVDVMVGLVDKILTLKKQNPKADTSALEKEIDQLVYALYNLTPEEIALVEGSEGLGLSVPCIEANGEAE